MKRLRWLMIVALVSVIGMALAWHRREAPQPPGTLQSLIGRGKLDAPWKNVLESAKLQAVDGARYDASYVRIAYPNGDVPITQGACTDVIVRAYRYAGYDLQKLIHEDMKKRASAYALNGAKLDTNIDHRRVRNQVVYFRKFGQTLTTRTDSVALKHWLPGDIVCWKLPAGLDHIGIISDRMAPSGMPMVIHNIAGCTEEDCLTEWKVVGHYRFPARSVNGKQ